MPFWIVALAVVGLAVYAIAPYPIDLLIVAGCAVWGLFEMKKERRR